MKRLLLPLALLALVASPGDAHAQQRRQADRKLPDCTATMGELPKEWSGQVFAIDGDTLAGAGLKPHIRLWGIQAPELRGSDKSESTPGMRARAALVDMLAISDNRATCRTTKWDRYCRMVAQCSVAGFTVPDRKPTPFDVGAFLVAAGYAYGFYLEEGLPWDAGAAMSYVRAEVEARKARKGLWPIWLGEK